MHPLVCHALLYFLRIAPYQKMRVSRQSTSLIRSKSDKHYQHKQSDARLDFGGGE